MFSHHITHLIKIRAQEALIGWADSINRKGPLDLEKQDVLAGHPYSYNSFYLREKNLEEDHNRQGYNHGLLIHT